MPAAGRGTHATPGYTAVGTKIKPPKPPPAPPGAPLRGGLAPSRPAPKAAPLPTQPFHAAQAHAQRAVEHATRALPPAPHPHLPIIAQPTVGQAHAALTVIHAALRRAVGPNPTPARLAAYQAELGNDPRLRQFRDAIRHYAAAAHRLQEPTAAQEALEAGASPLAALEAPAASAAYEIGAKQRALGLPQALKENAEGKDWHLPLANIDVTKLATKLATAHVVPGGLVGNVVNEAFDLPAQTFLSSAIAGAAAREAVLHGRTAPAEALGKNVLSQLEHPVKSAKEAPLSTALLFAGGENVLGRLAGRVGRAAKAGTLSPAAGRELLARPDLKLYGDVAVEGRRYNPDVAREALQKLYERHVLPNLPGELRQADPFQATGWRLNRHLAGRNLKVGVVDRVAAANEDTRRGMMRGNAAQLQAVHPGSMEHAVPLIVERTLRRPDTVVADLHAEISRYRHSLAEAGENGKPKIVGQERKALRANLENAEALAKNKAFLEDPTPAFKAAAEYERLHAPTVAERAHGGQLKEEQFRAALFPYAIRQLAGEHRLGEAPPEAVQAHLESKANVQDAGARLREARRVLNRKEDQLAKLAVRRHGEPVKAGIRAEAGGGDALKAAEAQLAAAKDEHAAAANALKGARRDYVPKPAEYAAMRAPDGHVLSNEEILQHMAENGVKPPGFISHQVGVAGRASHYASTNRQPSVESHARTGSASAKGTADMSWQALAGNLARSTGKAAQLQVRRRFLNRFAIGPQLANEKDAWAAADNFNTSPEGKAVTGAAGEVVPVHLGSTQIIERGHVAPQTASADVLRQFGLHEHTQVEPAAENGRFALIPKQVVDRLSEHETALQSNKAIGKSLQRYQTAFRNAKLTTSVPHITGIAQEQGIRLGFEGAGPTARAAGSKVDRVLRELAQVDKHGHHLATRTPGNDIWREIHSTIANRGGLAGVSGTKWQDAVRKADQFGESSGHVIRAGETLATKPVGKQMVQGWEGLKTVVQGGLAHVEHGTRNALLAKALRESGFIDSYHAVLKMTDQAVQDVLRGKMTPQKAEALAREVDNMGGNWNRQTPLVRESIAKFVPFGLWWLNSMRWLYRLPVTHPVKTAVLAALYQATRAQRNKEGQGYDAAHPVPNFLQGTIDTQNVLGGSLPLLGAGKIAPTYYSPGGTLGPEALTTAGDLIAPWLQGILAAARNQNPLSGARLERAGGGELSAPQAALNVLTEIAAGPTPFATQAEKVLTGGGKPYGTANLITEALGKAGLGPSQVKPGTERSDLQVLGKLLQPTRFDFPSSRAATSGSGASLNPRTRSALRRARHTGLNARTRAALRRAAKH